MSNDALKWAYAQELKRSRKSVLVALADYANADFVCWPSVETLAKKSGYGRSTVLDATKKLEQMGLLNKEYVYNSLGKRTGVKYRLSIVLSPKAGPREHLQDDDQAHSNSLSPICVRLSPDLPSTTSSIQTQTIIEPKEKPQIKEKELEEKESFLQPRVSNTHHPTSAERVDEIARATLSPELYRQLDRSRQKRKGVT